MKSLKYLLALLFIILFGINFFAQGNKSEKAKLLQELLPFKGLNLFDEKNSKLRQKVDNNFNRLVYSGKELEDRLNFPFKSVRYIWQSNNSNIAVMESPTFIFMPGQQTFTFYFCDKDGNLLNKENFSTGWKMFVTNVELMKSVDYDFPIIKFTTASWANIVKEIEYVALLGESIALIRLEESEKGSKTKISRYLYNCEQHLIGSKSPRKMSVDEWMNFLNSESKVEILQALIWLSGKHQTINEVKNSPSSKSDRCLEIIQDIETYGTLKSSQDIQERLKELAKSSNQWIKEAAILALTPIEKRKGN